MNTRKVYVVISSEEDIYFEQALLSAWSCRYHNHDTDISVLCDDRTYEYITASYDPEYLKAVFDHITLVDVPAKLKPVERSRWIKTSVRNLIGGDFLFVDTDTIICGSLSEIEQIDADIAAAYDLNCPLKRHPGGEGFRKLAENTFDCMMGEDSEYYNSGVVYVKDTDAAHKFYQKWHYLWKQGLKRGVVRDQNAMYKAADELPIGELPGIYNCQVLGSIQHLADAKIVHFFNAKWNSNEMSPFFGRRMYEEIKRYRIITKETQELTLRCKSSFVSPSVVISNDDVGIWFGSTFEKLRILYRDHKILYKLADLESRLVLRILNKFSRKNAGGGVKKDSVLIPLMYEVAA